MKKRWKGLCALWMILILVIGAFPVAGASEDAPESAAAAVSEAAKDDGGEIFAESRIVESSAEEEETVEDPVEEETMEDPAKDETTKEPEQSGESEETDKGTEGTEGTEKETEESTEATVSVEAWLYVGSNEVEAGSYVGDAGSAATYRKQVTVQFDESFDSQDVIMNITAPQDKRLSGWRLWGFNDSGMVGDSPLKELEITGQISADDYQGFPIDNFASFLLIVPLWRDVKAILDGDSLIMNPGDSCNLSDGTWQVDGDATVYTGGRTIYAARSGTFTFHKRE